MSGTGDGDREMGIDFGDLDEDLEDLDYPVNAAEITEEFGDRELEHSNGTSTVEEVIRPLIEDEEDATMEYDSAEEAQQEILNMVGAEAVGKQRYSDRGLDQDSEDQDSF